MNEMNIILCIVVMALVTYLIRMLPLVAFTKKINNNYVKSFLFYIPYGILASMTFPAILFSTQSIYSAIVGLIVAVVLAYKEKSLLTVAISACGAVLLVEIILTFI